MKVYELIDQLLRMKAGDEIRLRFLDDHGDRRYSDIAYLSCENVFPETCKYTICCINAEGACDHDD